jgi:hypothetical protein
MDKIAQLPASRRAELFRETAARKAMSPAIVEKDFWVCFVLAKLFADEFVSKKILFKGGTSLSKVYKVIERFSEDIDLILDWTEITGGDPLASRSRTKQDTFNKQLQLNSQSYIRDRLVPRVVEMLPEMPTIPMWSSSRILLRFPNHTFVQRFDSKLDRLPSGFRMPTIRFLLMPPKNFRHSLINQSAM